MGYVIAVVAVGVLIGLMRLTSPSLRSMANRQRGEGTDRVLRVPPPSGGMNRDRMPAGWYLAPSGDPPASPPSGSPGEHPTPVVTIAWWLGGGVFLAGLAALAWATSSHALGVFVALLGLVVIGRALHWWWRNRWLVQARTWIAGQRHVFPPAEDQT